jgi:hypothetical protein
LLMTISHTCFSDGNNGKSNASLLPFIIIMKILKAVPKSQ